MISNWEHMNFRVKYKQLNYRNQKKIQMDFLIDHRMGKYFLSIKQCNKKERSGCV